MRELKRPWRYRRHDVVRRTIRLLPEDAVVVSFESRALRGRRTLQHVGYGVSIRRAATVYTVNEPTRMRQLAGLGVDGIFTDRPDLLLQALAARPG
jgi:hypothetical protein